MRKASPFQAVKTWKTSTDPDYEAKKNRVLELYALADGKRTPDPGDPAVVVDLQALLDELYDVRNYGRRTHYRTKKPKPPLTKE